MKNHKFPYKWYLKDGYPAEGVKQHKLKVFTTFACGGGSSMGYKLAGFDVIGCNEIDPEMMKLYKANHHPKHSYLEDIRSFKDRTDLPEELYNLDVLDGSPPCSVFSIAGQREDAWGKEKKFREGQSEQTLDDLFFEFIDLAKKLQPKIIIAENVKGLLLGNAKGYTLEILTRFNQAGYDIQLFLLNSASMGVPQSRGDAQGAGNWELNKIASGGGTTSLTMVYPLQNTYQDSGISGGGESQIVEMKQYSLVTITGAAAKLFTVTGWNGNRGGIGAFFCTGETKIINGGSIGENATNEGFRGAAGRGQGEGTGGGPGAPNEAANGNGGGGTFGDWGTGAGGGNGTAGANGTVVIGGGPLCIGGLAKGNAALTVMVLGGGGGCGTGDTGGGYGGGMWLIISKKITIDSTAAGFFLKGGNGTGSIAQHGGGGAGAGGSALLKGQEIILGNYLLLATGGPGGAGGNGGAGRVHVDYSKSLSGTTTPSLDSSLDKTLADPVGGFFADFV